ncbi:hypothetical protein BC938DRAFT_476442 [Jimgerdemannia flammicorona]|uniref:Protein kinase domain-containing protein n=1 Tax=Jimgerdemannia flammicorona TaxID=994334 RepID=A0A433PH37_9FUNG|nr:hypothetical protein BC938DRAFT_476442 [Jimgerdemannia flammicorona]
MTYSCEVGGIHVNEWPETSFFFPRDTLPFLLNNNQHPHTPPHPFEIHMATSDRAQEFLRSLAPFEKLEQSTRLLIQALKHEFPYQNALKSHLTELGVPRLADYLVWIPHHRFEEDMEEIGRGGFGTVHKATVEAFDERGFKTLHKNGDELVYDKNFVRTFALKEVDISIIVPEVCFLVFFASKSF